MKLVYSDPKTGKSTQIEIDSGMAAQLINQKIGDVIDGGPFGVPGKLKITGGSDNSGFPMLQSVDGTRKVRILRTINVGKSRGTKKRQMVVGNLISPSIQQINAVIVYEGEDAKKAKTPKAEAKAKKPEAASAEAKPAK